jgi:hypothetical protein
VVQCRLQLGPIAAPAECLQTELVKNYSQLWVTYQRCV